MELLRIILTQNKANYRVKESVDNKMTYPLPPLSTVIGALHRACNFTEYKEMFVSVQGSYKSKKRETHREHIYLNSVNDDRGVLVKVETPKCLSAAYVKVAGALKQNESIISEEKNIIVYNRELLEEYKRERAKKKNERSKEWEKFFTLVTDIRQTEVLYDVKLILHIAGEKEVLNTVKSNIYNLKAIGRSEDFVNVEECIFVEAEETDEYIYVPHQIYINYNDYKKGLIVTDTEQLDYSTLYYHNKEWEVKKSKKLFKKEKLILAGDLNLKGLSDKKYIISLT